MTHAYQILGAPLLTPNSGIEEMTEGVEEATQRDQLRALGCTSAQGYLFARPLSSSQLSGWMATEENAARGQPSLG